jgi:hypothetical protein
LAYDGKEGADYMKKLGIFLFILCLSILSFTLVNAKPNNIEGLEIKYERAFVHDINGVTVQLDVTNKTGKDVKIVEGDLISNVEGFEILRSDYYQFNGKTLKNNKSKNNWLLMYFDKRAKATELEWVQPTFKVIIDGEAHELKGEKMYVE